MEIEDHFEFTFGMGNNWYSSHESKKVEKVFGM